MCDIEENETQNYDSVSLYKDKSKNESPATMIKEKSEDEILDTLEVKSSSDCTGVTRDQSDAPDKTVATELKRLPVCENHSIKLYEYKYNRCVFINTYWHASIV